LQIPSLIQGKKNCQKNEKKKEKSPPKFTTTAYKQSFSFCGEISRLGEFVFQKMKKKKTDTNTIHLFVILGKTSPFFEIRK
jgi:hypothetical protein